MDNFANSLLRELRFASRDRVLWITLLIAALLASLTIVHGIKEVAQERALIDRVEQLVTDDRAISLASQSDAGGAAYYAFHFTYDPPTNLAFASRGVRDELPWKHRLRMLALEGQIYETDPGNPELSRIGKLDFAFLAAFLLPLFSIVLLHDLRAVEIRNNRWEFLSATSGDGSKLLINRAVLRSLLLYLCIAIPFSLGAYLTSANLDDYILVISAIVVNVLIWMLFALFIASRLESGSTTAAVLLGLWFMTAVAIPVGGKLIVEQAIDVPEGGEILLTQREAVNDAWDLPKEATMAPFVDQHPEWADAAQVNLPFEWKWYYAFQQVGDQTVEPLSKKLRYGILNRDKAMGVVSLASPSLLTARLISRAADTDIAAFQRYDACVRAFHASLREFHYPMLFEQIEYSADKISNLPTYKPCLP